MGGPGRCGFGFLTAFTASALFALGNVAFHGSPTCFSRTVGCDRSCISWPTSTLITRDKAVA